MAKLIVSSIFSVILSVTTIASTYWIANYGPEWQVGQPYPYIIFPVMSGGGTVFACIALFMSAAEYDEKKK